ncbi:T9SS type A sorting domain-containing protein [Dyadobacter luticola]|uniref:T9SS type A sorting domain-containing protein n=1 Tax=Dyadobacter luticola TaxID=1979387 RepID=A0A5R9L1C0_9BACT|nr:T9SS type A sorting domain-containing protein [Dyadobacter luticola]TLV02149.1 T9SS type A sorting domain-containing protein [Dyadobacter luticola]
MIGKLLFCQSISLWRKAFAILLTFAIFQAELSAQTRRNKAYVASGGQITILKNFDFGVDGSLSAIIRTDRELPYGVVNFAANIHSVNGGDKAHVDGYVRKFGSANLLFPVGNKGFYGPFSATADGTTGAYFRQNPSDASYRASSKDQTIGPVNLKEFWDIDGKNKTKISLTWDADSKVDTLVDQLSKLTIIGWKNGMWVTIPSKVDSISILKKRSDLQSGSITTADAIAPNDFEVYTLAGKADPPIVIDSPLTNLTVYPNPASEVLKLAQEKTAKPFKKETLRITDILGRDRTDAVYWIKDDLHIGNLIRGMYIISFQDQSGKSISSKFLVAR